MSTIKKLIADLDTSIAQLSETITDYGKGKLQAFRDVRIHIQNEVPDNEESLRQQNKELVEMLEKVSIHVDWSYDNWTSNDGNIIKDEITELLNKVK